MYKIIMKFEKKVLKSMQNSEFLAVLRLSFGLKTKILPPKGNWGERKLSESWQFFFGDHLFLTEKPPQKFG